MQQEREIKFARSSYAWREIAIYMRTIVDRYRLNRTHNNIIVILRKERKRLKKLDLLVN